MKTLFKRKAAELILGRHPTTVFPGVIGTIIGETHAYYIVQYPGRKAKISKLQAERNIGEHTPYVVFKNSKELEVIGQELAVLWKTIEKMSKDPRFHINVEAKQSWSFRQTRQFLLQ